MARVDAKARFYLEQSVPQLREFEDKGIFSKDEIRTLVQKRTDYERLILSPGSQPSDVLAYIAWDQSLDRLRAKRCRRLNIKQSTSNASQGRIFKLFERGVSRHPGSTLLWRSYLDYAAQLKATKRWRRIMTRALRMLPSDGSLWVLAGRKAFQDGDMAVARGFFMRGCRFCTTEPLVWVEYARLEMEWLARLEKKKGTPAHNMSVAAAVAAAAAESHEGAGGNDEIIAFRDGDGGDDGDDDDDEASGDDDFSKAALLPKELTEPPTKKGAADSDIFTDEAVRKLEATPALQGAIPQAIFEAARAQPFFGPEAAEAFFAIFARFVGAVAAHARLVDLVAATLDERYPDDAATWTCRAKRALLGLDPGSPRFPRALQTALGVVWDGLDKVRNRAQFAAKSGAWMAVFLRADDLDPALRTVLEDAKTKLERLESADPARVDPARVDPARV